MKNDLSEEYVECDYNNSIFLVPKDVFAKVVLETQSAGSRYVRYKVGARMYGMSERSFYNLAHEAGAICKWGKMALVDIETVDSYLALFREEDNH